MFVMRCCVLQHCFSYALAVCSLTQVTLLGSGFRWRGPLGRTMVRLKVGEVGQEIGLLSGKSAVLGADLM